MTDLNTPGENAEPKTPRRRAAKVTPSEPAPQTKPAQPSAPAREKKPASTSTIVIAAVAAGAIVGGIAGAGVTAFSIDAFGSRSVENYTRDAITIANTDSATVVSAIAAKATPSVVTLQVSSGNASGTGSGVIIDTEGYILTNNHVVSLDGASGEPSIRVFMSDGRILTGELVGTDPYSDLAVVKIDADNLTAIKFADSAKLNVGDLTVAIGAPLNLPSTVTSGVISALNRGITVGSTTPEPQGDSESNPEDLWNFDFDRQEQQPRQQSASGSITIPVIQTDASINPGNSGGALLNADGKLIGINVAIASTASSNETAGSVGLGFAIPSNLAKRVSEAIIAGEDVSHGLLGVNIGDAASAENATQTGALVVAVTPDGAAAKAGIKKDDVILSVNGVSVSDGTSLSSLVRYYPAGTEVKIEYLRDGKVATTTATLGSL